MSKEKYIVVFSCRFAVGPEALHPHEASFTGKGIRWIRLTCGASVHSGLILSTIEEGAEGVVLVTCPDGQCHYGEGSQWASRVTKKVGELLKLLGFSPDRVKRLTGEMGQKTSEDIRSFADDLGVRIGPKLTFYSPRPEREAERTKR
ncbi:MAG: hydrogenase iron-sulfur subunit [Planctomycetota bacterium]|jgi:coenzyme F420-reducing hydrogenase delta subunit